MKPKAQNTIGEMIDGAEQKVMNDLREQLRRQREINAELLGGLKLALHVLELVREKHPRCPDDDSFDALEFIRSTIAKASSN